jgi:diguanylate cyclase (GGDEF)-like protein
VAEGLKSFDLSKFSDRDSRLLRLYSKNEGIKSFFAVPVMREGILEGVLCVDSKKAFVFANRDQKLLTLFAKQFADAVNNTRIRKFADMEASDTDSLRGFCSKIATAHNMQSVLQLTLNSIMRLVECDSCFLSLRINDEDERFRIEAASNIQSMKGMVFSSQDGLAGCVIRSKEPFLLANRREELGSYVFVPSESVGRVRSFLGMPLLIKGDTFGLICLIDGRENSFNRRDLRVTSIVADSASLAIANAEAQDKVHRLSTITDGLTGLHNFSGFQQSLEALFQELTTKRRPLSLIVMDLDDLKNLNSLLGYEVGNEILKKVAQLLLEILEEDNNISAARYGSDEFALVLPNTTKERAFLIAEEICRAIDNPTFIAPSYGVRVSISVGVSSFPRDGVSKNELVQNAFRALSLAKSRGGGRAIRYDARSAGIRI